MASADQPTSDEHDNALRPSAAEPAPGGAPPEGRTAAFARWRAVPQGPVASDETPPRAAGPSRPVESVWDYPRPPRVEPASERVWVVFGGLVIADSRYALRVLETSHPPVYYFPLEDVHREHLWPSTLHTWCEFKGMASYFDVRVGDRLVHDGAWYYHLPSAGYEELADCVAFYPGKMDACYVDGERVQAQEGDFYGGWITRNIVGPFKGGPGTRDW